MAKTKKNTKTQKPAQPQYVPDPIPSRVPEEIIPKEEKPPAKVAPESKAGENVVLDCFLENKEDLTKKLQAEKLRVQQRKKKFSLPEADAEKKEMREMKFGGAQKKVLLERSKKFGLTGNEETNQLVRMRMAKFQSQKVEINQQQQLRAQKFGAPIRKMRKLA